MLPVNAFRDNEMALAVSRSCRAAGSVPFKLRPDSHSPAMPPARAVLVKVAEGETYTR
jgi:hypothetical protein